MKFVKIVFWPYHYVEEEETKPLLKTASKSDAGNLRTRHHAPARRLPTRTDARHASHESSPPGWADPTRIPDDPTYVPDPEKDDVIMTPVYTVSMHVSAQSSGTSASSQHAMSSYSQQHINVQSLDTSSLWVPPATSPAASRVEPSRVGAEPSREPRDKIMCSRVYVQPDLRLNLGRSSGQNCFDQILAVWNAIWMISDLFPANLIIPDAMVRSDHWDLRPKMAVVN
jgi:hypothetical protein